MEKKFSNENFELETVGQTFLKKKSEPKFPETEIFWSKGKKIWVQNFSAKNLKKKTLGQQRFTS